MGGTTHLFCPTMRFSLPNPDFCCHSLYSIFIYCLPSTYTIVESNAICHFLQQFFEPLWLNPIFLLFQTVCSIAPPARLSVQSSHPSGGLFHLSPFLVLRGSLLTSVGFFFFFLTYSSHWTLRLLPQRKCCLPFLPAVFCVL